MEKRSFSISSSRGSGKTRAALVSVHSAAVAQTDRSVVVIARSEDSALALAEELFGIAVDHQAGPRWGDSDFVVHYGNGSRVEFTWPQTVEAAPFQNPLPREGENIFWEEAVEFTEEDFKKLEAAKEKAYGAANKQFFGGSDFLDAADVASADVGKEEIPPGVDAGVEGAYANIAAFTKMLNEKTKLCRIFVEIVKLSPVTYQLEVLAFARIGDLQFSASVRTPHMSSVADPKSSQLEYEANIVAAAIASKLGNRAFLAGGKSVDQDAVKLSVDTA